MRKFRRVASCLLFVGALFAVFGFLQPYKSYSLWGPELPSAYADKEAPGQPPAPAPSPLMETTAPASPAGNCVVDPMFSVLAVGDIPSIADKAPKGKYPAFLVAVEWVRKDRETKEWRVALEAPCYPPVGPFELPVKAVLVGYRDGNWFIDPTGLVDVVDGRIVKVRHAWHPTSKPFDGGEVAIKAYVQRKGG